MTPPPESAPKSIPAGMREERKVVTALTSDLAGSTALGERLDPEEIKLVVGEAVSRMVQAVEAFGGTVKDLAGDGVLALFGAPVTHEDDAERAVRAALRIVRDITVYAGEVEAAWGIEGLAVRVGINTGPVVLGAVGAGRRVEYGAFGDTVNTAARLQTAAEHGAVLVSAHTQHLVEALFDWGEPRELLLKGKGQAVVAYPVTGGGSTATGAHGSRELQSRLIGRDREMSEAREVLDGVLAGTGGILFVTGEAGIGKSRLLIELRDVFQSAGALLGNPLWMEGRCVSYGESLTYWPYRDLLREWLDVGPGDPELRVRVALRRRMERLFGDRILEVYAYLGAMLGLALEPDAAARLTELSPEALQYRTFEVVGELIERLAREGPVALVLEDLHWADATSIQLTESLLRLTERAAVLFVIAQRDERDHQSWRTKEAATRELPHRTRDIALEALSGNAERELLHSLVGENTLPADLERRVLEDAEGNPFYLEELIGSLVDAGALVPSGRPAESGGEGVSPGSSDASRQTVWRFDHEVPVQVPETVEKVLLARIDRLEPECHNALTAASVLGRQFSLPLLEGVCDNDTNLRRSLTELQRLDLLREGRRWPEPEYRFKHALIQEAAYRTLLTDRRVNLHRKAAEWLERSHTDNPEEVFGLLAHHWLSADDDDKAINYLTRAGDMARQEYALDEAVGHYRALLPLLERRGERQAIALVLFKLALALHTSLRFGEANETYQRAFDHWSLPEPSMGPGSAPLRIGTSFLPNDPDPKSAIAWPNIQLCMQLFDRLVEAWPERTIVPSLAERWEISDDGLRYVFHLREGLTWSDGRPLTAGDVEFGIKRVLDPNSPGSSVAIYFVLENGQDYYLGRNEDADAIGVRAIDDRTVEFRLVAPAPYFMSAMNRPDAGPQPQHAIELHGDAWTQPDKQVVSGSFQRTHAQVDEVVLERRQGRLNLARSGNVRRVDLVRTSIEDALRGPFATDDLDMVLVRYMPRLADLTPGEPSPDVTMGGAAWSAYLAFDHTHPSTSNLDLRKSLAHAIDRNRLTAICPANLVVATGGVVPPVLQGHTPDIALRFDPDLAREHFRRSGFAGTLEIAAMEVWRPFMEEIAEMWQKTLERPVQTRSWSWQAEEAIQHGQEADKASIRITGWLPGYPDPEYYLRLLFQTDSRTNEGGFSYALFDQLIERARMEPRDRTRLELFREADRMAVADRVALIPLVYGRSTAYLKPWIHGWWEFGKSSANFADLMVDRPAPG